MHSLGTARRNARALGRIRGKVEEGDKNWHFPSNTPHPEGSADRFAHSAGLEGRQENHEEQKRKSWMMTKTMLRMMTVVKMRIMRIVMMLNF